MILDILYYKQTPGNEAILYYDKELTNQAGIITFITYSSIYGTSDVNLQTTISSIFTPKGSCIANYTKANSKFVIKTITTYTDGFNNGLQILYTREYLDNSIRKVTLSTLD